MFFSSKRLVRDPYSLSTYEAEQPIRLDDARLDAWALSLGQRREVYQLKRNPHRGMLPDVDLSRTVPVANRPGWVARAFNRLAGKRPDAALPGDTSGETTVRSVALGEGGRKPYVWLVEADASEPEKNAPSVPAAKYNGSRAA